MASVRSSEAGSSPEGRKGRGGKGGRILRRLLWITALPVLLYLLLALRLLGEIPSRIVGTLASGNGTTLEFVGLRSDLFWSTSVDTVRVTTEDGLVVLVSGTSVRGSLAGYLVSRHVGDIRVERLEIALSTMPDDRTPHSSLEEILDSIDESIPTGADRLTLVQGRITEGSATVVDSMHLETSVDRGAGVALHVDSARVWLPGFGILEGRGDLALAACTVSTDGFDASAAPGNLSLRGAMSGPGGSLDVLVDGRAGTAFTGLPIDISSSFSGRISGPLSALHADLAFDGGRAVLFGCDASISADTVEADLDRLLIRGLRMAGGPTVLDLDAELDVASGAWSLLLGCTMEGTDPAGCWPGLPQGALYGTLTVEAGGAGDSIAAGSVRLALSGSSAAGIRIDRLDLSAAVDGGILDAGGDGVLEDHPLSFRIGGVLGERFLPDRLDFQAQGEIDSEFLESRLGLHGLPAFPPARVELHADGSGFAEGLPPADWRLHVSAGLPSIEGLSRLGIPGLDRLGTTLLVVDASGAAREGEPVIDQAAVHLETHAPVLSPAVLLGTEGIPDIHGLDLRLDGRGSRFWPGLVPGSWTAEVDASAASLGSHGVPGLGGMDALDGISLSVSGSGSRFSADLQGTLALDSLALGPLSVVGARVTGILDLARGSTHAEGRLLADSLCLAGGVYAVEAAFDLQDEALRVDTLHLTGPDGSALSARLSADFGETTRFEATDILVAHSKHRLISDGALSGHVAGEAVVLDTLWLVPPVGAFSASGYMDRDSLRLSADVDRFDLTSLRTLIGLPESMSGVASLSLLLERSGSDVAGRLRGSVLHPAYGRFIMDSLTVDVSTDLDSLTVHGLYAWRGGVRSGLQLAASGIWGERGLEFGDAVIDWIELEVNDLGDWLFYALPLPVRTIGASVSARAEYRRTDGVPRLEIQASARIERLFITILGVELPRVNFYLSYPDSTEEGYNARLTLGSGDASSGNFASTLLADIRDVHPFSVGAFRITAQMESMEVPIPGMGAVIASGEIHSSGDGTGERPLLSGHIRVLEGAVGIPQSTGASQGGAAALPFDLAISVTGPSGIWFRTSSADIEASLKLKIITLEGRPTVNGSVSAVRGRITMLQNEFDIIEGKVELVQGVPIQMNLNVSAVTTIRSLMDQQSYEITVLITGTADNPEIALSGTGPAGSITQEDILTLLAVGVTYGEMQQLNSAALRTEVSNVAQSLVGSLLARNIRHQIGLDTFEISPELFSDTTSLVLNIGKYVLPSLYVSYKGDVFSADPGTFSLQYLFSQDLYVEGTTRSTFHEDLEPTLELHYTIRY